MVWLIILSIIFIMIGSAMWLLPSAKEKHQMQLRMGAMKHGLKVDTVKFDDLSPMGRVENSTKHCVRYSLFLGNKKVPESLVCKGINPEWMDDKAHYYRGEKFVWFGQNRESIVPLAEKIESLFTESFTEFNNLAVDGVEVNQAILSIYWRENDGSSALEKIKNLLDQIQSMIHTV